MAPVRIWGNANGSDSKSANWKIESSERSRDFRVAPTLWKGASPETKTEHLLSSTKDIRKCSGKNNGRSIGMASPFFWMKRGSNGKKPNYCLAKNSATSSKDGAHRAY